MEAGILNRLLTMAEITADLNRFLDTLPAAERAATVFVMSARSMNGVWLMPPEQFEAEWPKYEAALAAERAAT